MNKQLEYLTGEIAEYFSLTNMGIHHLEKKDVIHSTRQENGYRVYSANELTKLGEIRAYERMGFSLKEANSFRYDYSIKKDKIQEKINELTKKLELLQYYESLFDHDIVKLNDPLSNTNTFIEESINLYWYPCWEEQYDLDIVDKNTLNEMKKIDCSWLAAMPYMQYCSKVDFSHHSIKACRGNSISEEYVTKENVVITPLVEKYTMRKALTFICELDDYSTILNKVKTFTDISLFTRIALFRILETAIPENENHIIAKVIIPFK